MQKIAILGGTFNPVHLGHLQIALTAQAQLQLQRVIWLPIRQPFHKQQATSASFEQRLEMVRLAIARHNRFELNSAAADSYAIGMLQRLQAVYPQSQWYWLIGQDALQTLPRWKGRQALAETCCWLVAPRANLANLANLAQDAPEVTCQQVAETMLKQAMPICWQLLRMQTMPISSSLIRQRRQQGQSIREFVPEPVEQYILAHQLYQTGSDFFDPQL